MQIFVKNQRQWRAPALRSDQITAFRNAERSSRVRAVVAHASYLLNVASPNPQVRNRSVSALVDESERCEALGVPSLVMHPGAYLESTVEKGIRRVAESLDKVHSRTRGFGTMILLETTAGQGTSLGHAFEHIADIIARTKKPERVGVCLDTCHLFAAGYDFTTPERYADMIDRVEHIIGLARVKCIHLNDSKRELGSRVDRHEHIGKGKIGRRGFAHLVNDRRFAEIPMILETPKGTDGRGREFDKINLARLRSLVG